MAASLGGRAAHIRDNPQHIRFDESDLGADRSTLVAFILSGGARGAGDGSSNMGPWEAGVLRKAPKSDVAAIGTRCLLIEFS
jgi:hypothetical protein